MDRDDARLAALAALNPQEYLDRRSYGDMTKKKKRSQNPKERPIRTLENLLKAGEAELLRAGLLVDSQPRHGQTQAGGGHNPRRRE